MQLRVFPTAAARPFAAALVVALLFVGGSNASGQDQVVPVQAGDGITSTVPTTPTEPAASLTANTSSTIAPKRVVVLTGRGFGHGRGLGQWGAYGYAKDLGWNYRRILDHYYGGTVAGQVSPRSAIGVRLIGLDTKTLMIYQPKGRLYTAPEGQAGFTLPPGLAGAQSPVALGGTEPDPLGAPSGPIVAVAAAGSPSTAPVTVAPVEPPLLSAGPAAIKVQLVKGGFQISDGPTCTGPWSDRPGLLASPSVTITSGPADPTLGPDDPLTMLQACIGTQRRVYRGDLLAVDGKPGQRTVNLVGLDAYLRGVVPREIAASWGDKAPESVKAQAVAARSYAAAEKRNGYSNTCDTIACQVYSGRGVYEGTKFQTTEDPRTDLAIAATANEVRVNAKTGAPIRTEFSASTGGFTAPGDFPPVPDAGDATDANPNHQWTVRLLASRFETSKLGSLVGAAVTKRDGFGDGGGRVKEIMFRYSNGNVSRTGVDLMTSFGLRSSWFDVQVVAEGADVTDTTLEPVAALTGDAGGVVQAAAAITTPPNPTASAAGTKATKATKRTPKSQRSVPTSTAVIVVAAGAAPVNTVLGGVIAGAPTTKAPITTRAVPPKTKKKRATKAR